MTYYMNFIVNTRASQHIFHDQKGFYESRKRKIDTRMADVSIVSSTALVKIAVKLRNVLETINEQLLSKL